MVSVASDRPGSALGLIAGTAVRDGFDESCTAHRRADHAGQRARLQALSTGGFAIDVPFTATALRELAKMDGAIILNDALDRILFAGVHLVTDAAVDTTETGTRHRTADRVARQIGAHGHRVGVHVNHFVVRRRHRWVVATPEQLLARANQALATLARYCATASARPPHGNAAKVQDAVTVTATSR